MTLAHVSDIHFGRLANPHIVDALVADINRRNVELVIVSGDLTQRAHRRQFREAARMVGSFNAPVIVVPGNHDVPPWWVPWLRLRNPYRRFLEYITADLYPSVVTDNLAVAGINSAYAWTIKSGRIRHEHVAFLRDFFSKANPDAFKVLVLHHHLTRVRGLGPHDVARFSERALDCVKEYKIDLVLCGHLHRSNIETVALGGGAHRVVIASAGTATSNRWRGRDKESNLYNLITVDQDAFVVDERRYEFDTREFATLRIAPFSRQRTGMRSVRMFESLAQSA